MKLRNKNTGEIGINDAEQIEEKRFCIRSLKTGCVYVYDSLAKLNDEWEDYKPVEPLIKDKKIRKLVSDWAKLTQAAKILTVKRRTSIGAKFTEFFSQEKCISLEFLGRFDELEDGKEYGIAELCGEE